MNHHKRTTFVSVTMLAAALWLCSSNETSTVAQAASDPWGRFTTTPRSSVLSGARINVALGRNISSETAKVGDAWHGTVTEYVMTQDESVIPPGSEVDGVVTGVTPAERGSPAMLELGVRRIRVNGHDELITATADAVIAGSPRARELGAIAGGTAAGELIDEAVEDVENTAVGGVFGGTVVLGVVARSKGNLFVLSDGTVISFTASQTVAMQ